MGGLGRGRRTGDEHAAVEKTMQEDVDEPMEEPGMLLC
jgi:hypothetical protein